MDMRLGKKCFQLSVLSSDHVELGSPEPGGQDATAGAAEARCAPLDEGDGVLYWTSAPTTACGSKYMCGDRPV